MPSFGFSLTMDDGVIAHCNFTIGNNNDLLCNKLEVLVPNEIPISNIDLVSIILEITDSIESEFTYSNDCEIIMSHYDYYLSDEEDNDLLDEFRDFVAKSSPILCNSFATGDIINRQGPLSAANCSSLRQIAI